MSVLYGTYQEHKPKVSRTLMELLDQIETYLAQHRMPPSKFGRLAVGDPRFVEDLRGGRLPRAKTCDRVKRYLGRDC